jgi:hypothetical protein
MKIDPKVNHELLIDFGHKNQHENDTVCILIPEFFQLLHRQALSNSKFPKEKHNGNDPDSYRVRHCRTP